MIFLPFLKGGVHIATDEVQAARVQYALEIGDNQ